MSAKRLTKLVGALGGARHEASVTTLAEALNASQPPARIADALVEAFADRYATLSRVPTPWTLVTTAAAVITLICGSIGITVLAGALETNAPSQAMTMVGLPIATLALLIDAVARRSYRRRLAALLTIALTKRDVPAGLAARAGGYVAGVSRRDLDDLIRLGEADTPVELVTLAMASPRIGSLRLSLVAATAAAAWAVFSFWLGYFHILTESNWVSGWL